MPIYEYKCADCGHHLEVLQKFSDEPLKQCPECNALQLKKLVSVAGFRLAGSGWYETDFKTGNKRNLAGDQTESSNKSSADDKGGDSKASAKPPDKPANKPSEKKKENTATTK